ncbi:phosphatidylserine receptor [Mucor ambiguus]|uniref:Phosphatidylserine receptor n=1 Tax=Mucor ambiguus TaxID=91626 RepID=A0A0C9LX87_9FUNG|nr:phosphatidylserine receptor [Mucor ambiguus]
MVSKSVSVQKSEQKKYKQSKHARYETKINRIKHKCRSELDLFHWQKWKFHENDYWIDSFVDTLKRIDYRNTSKSEFVKQYEAKNIPVMITHVTDHWKANKHWTEEYLLKHYGSHLFKVGDDDDNKNVYMKMKHFLHYSSHDGLKDDSPLYIFDSGFYKASRSKKKNSLLDDYQVPKYFEEDLFKLTGERRPPYRWLVIGGARSGTGIHKDPLGTSAWNSLVKGHKRWCLFLPNTPKELYDPPMKPYDHEGISWFDQVYPRFKKRLADGQTLGEKWGMVEVLQKPGETIFVPGGWPHVVMNLDLTAAVTQNFCSSTNAEYVYLSTRHSRPKLGQKLYREIQKLGRYEPEKYAHVAKSLEATQYIPQLPPSSSSSGSSSTSSSSSSSSSNSDSNQSVMASAKKKRKFIMVSSTDSETDREDGTCMCKKFEVDSPE